MAKKKNPKAKVLSKGGDELARMRAKRLQELYDLEYVQEEIVKVKQEIQYLRENNPNPERMPKGIGEKELELSRLENRLESLNEDIKRMFDSIPRKRSEEEVKRNYEKNNPIEARIIKIFRYTFFAVAFIFLIWLFFFLE